MTNRLLAFFLTTLAVVLIGFSAAVCFVANRYLFDQVDERLGAALNTLCAAAEIDSTGVDWELEERQLRLNAAAFNDRFIWYVLDDQNQLIDGKSISAEIQWTDSSTTSNASQRDRFGRMNDGREEWRFTRQRLEKTPLTTPSISTEANLHDPHKYDGLEIGVGLSLEPTYAALRKLIGLATTISTMIWLIALITGRLICRRALRPVTQMATVANDIDVNDLSRRLPTSTSGDELEMLGHSFNSLLDRLQESFERQRRFTGDASHQLRTPIASILGQSDVALRRTRSTEDYERTLKTVRQQATHLQSIVESLLFLARADSEGRVDRFDLVEASTLLDDLQKSWAAHIRNSDLQFQCTITGSKSLRVQPVLFAELINILINNACKFSEPGTPIVIQLLEEGQSLIFEIRDQGIGISESDLGQVFRPFFRSRETIQRGIEGTGLGLSIALRLALAMGGTLSVTSQPGQGSCFSLRLPFSDRPSN